MNLKRITFGNQLSSFSKAVDIVTNDVKANILNLIQEKLKESLKIEFVTLHVETIVDDHLGLNTTDWCIGGGRLGVISIKNNLEGYTKQIALAFDKNKPLWIVDNEKQALQDCRSNYLELWSRIDSKIIPCYSKLSDTISKTSIILPLTRVNEDKPYGVINFDKRKT